MAAAFDTEISSGPLKGILCDTLCVKKQGERAYGGMQY